MAVADLQAEALATVKEESQFALVMRRFRRHRLAVIGSSIIVIFILAAVFAPWIAPYDIYEQNLAPPYSNPSPEHILGPDELGRDVFSRLLYAARL